MTLPILLTAVLFALGLFFRLQRWLHEFGLPLLRFYLPRLAFLADPHSPRWIEVLEIYADSGRVVWSERVRS